MRLDAKFLLRYKRQMDLMTTRDAAKALGVSLRQVQTLIQQGKLPAEKVGRDYFIMESDLKLVEHRPVGRPPKAKTETASKAGKKQSS